MHLLQLSLALTLHPGELFAQLVVVKLRIQLLLLTEELDARKRRLHDGVGCLAAQAQLQQKGHAGLCPASGSLPTEHEAERMVHAINSIAVADSLPAARSYSA
eukprot:GHRQ01030220.1.p2 GENE.GHRQ01030220.1~~GHRQ01030220.1.p2  ORF type:complete len:103 (+),score=12.45 GHRQ01030220.1:317-625(+)